MRNIIFCMVIIIQSCSVLQLYAQERNAPVFGKDIVIQDNCSQDQQNMVTCSAFNGWLYGAYSYNLDGYGFSIEMLKSVDGGVTWSHFMEIPYEQPFSLTTLDIITCGNDLSNLKVFVAMIATNAVMEKGNAYVLRFNGITGMYEVDLLSDPGTDISDIAIANDNTDPAPGTNPGSLAFAFCRRISADSVFLWSSIDGGMTITNRKSVKYLKGFCNQITLNYGRCASHDSGTYFITWEMRDKYYSPNYHIYTSHTQYGLSGPLTKSFCIDSLDITMNGNLLNPQVACQFGGFDNDSSNLTEIILAEKKDSSGHKSIIGFVNSKAATTNNFTLFPLTSSDHVEHQPSIAYNPFDSTFMVTYYDSTTQKLPFLCRNLNAQPSDPWQVISDGYNDTIPYLLPNPSVKLSNIFHNGMTSWSGNCQNGNGQALFDFPTSTYNGITELETFKSQHGVRISPNPCSSSCNFQFELNNDQQVLITIYDH